MTPIRILVAQTRDDFLATGITETIRRTPDFKLMTGKIVPVMEVESLVQEAGASLDAVILIGNESDIDVVDLLARHPSLVVLRIAFGRDAVRLDLRNAGLDQLVATIRALVRRHGDGLTERLLEYEVATDPPPGAIKSTESIRVPHRGRVIDNAVMWIDAVLLLHIKSRRPEGDELPGLTLSQATAEGAVSSRPGPADPSLGDATRAVEFAVDELLAALDAADPRREPLAAVKRYLKLSVLDMLAFLLCLAPELHVKYQRVFGFLNDDLGRRSPTLGLICSLLLGDPLAARTALTTSNKLGRWRLLSQASDVSPRADEPLQVED
ncbi:MAG: hypothetical protein ACREVE_12030 [Gammaproteobacteria bacterium]